MLEDSIINRILGAWAADQDHPHRGRDKRPLPNFNDVKEVVETAFLASLKREEGRPVRFSIVLASDGETDDSSHRYKSDARRFHNAVAFSVASILKLAPAFNPDLSSLGVGRNPVTGDFECWGSFHYPPQAHMFNQVPVGVEGGGVTRPDLFMVSARSPGLLYISRTNSRIGRFVDGDFIATSPTPFTSMSLGGYLIESLKPTYLGQNNHYWHCYREALDVLLSESASRGHGATVAILNADGVTSTQGLFSPKYTVKGHGRLKSRFENAWGNKKTLLAIVYNKLIHQYLQELAQLSTVDGALILTRELELVAFGSTLSAPRWTGKILHGPDGFGRSNHEAFPAQRYGTRHSSAIDFAAACNGSTVFVVSQDGAVRAFLRSSEDTVLCWPDCTASMFV